MSTQRFNSRFLVVIPALILLTLQSAHGIPSPLEHMHTGATVHWKEAGSPALPWSNIQANVNDHNHLTADAILVAGKWDINKAWDNRTLSSEFDSPAATDWAHGMILKDNAVRYGWGASIPNDAKDAVEIAYNDWLAKAATQFNAKKDATDVLAIDFDRVNSGAKEITIDFVANFGSYGTFSSSAQTIKFDDVPDFRIKTSGRLQQIRLGDSGPSGAEIVVVLNDPLIFPGANGGWSWDGTPASKMVDFDYSVDGGVNWTDAPPPAFGNLDWAGANYGHPIVAGDKIKIFEMDFRTIARHEVGHSIALGHIGSDTTAIMRTDIADFALFGNTMQIDSDSSLAVAIDYTYSVPEPATLGLLTLGALAVLRRRRR